MPGVNILVTAATAQAAADLKAFCNTCNSDFIKVQNAGIGAGNSFSQIREGARSLSEGFRTLEVGAYLLGGQRFPQLAQAVWGTHGAMLAVRSVAKLTGASLTATAGTLFSFAAAALPGVIAGWKAYKAAEEEAASVTALHNQTLKLQEENLKRVAAVLKTGLIGPGKADTLSAMIHSGREGTLLAQHEMFRLGLQGNLDVMEEFSKAEKEIYRDSLGKFDQERLAALDKYQARLDVIKAAQASGGQFADPIRLLEARTTAEKDYKAQLLEIDHKAQQERLTADENSLALDAEHLRIAQQIAQAASEEARAKNESTIALVKGNPFLTDVEKAGQLISLYRAQTDLDSQRINQLKQMATATGDPAAQLEAQRQMNELMREQASLQLQITGAQGVASFSYQFQLAVVHLRDLNNVAQETAQLFSNVMEKATQSIASNLTQVIEGTKSWHAALIDIARTLVTDILQGLIQIVARLAEELIIDIAIKALTGGVGFAGGGYTGNLGTGSVAGVVHGGEYVMSAPAVQRIGVQRLEALHRGYSDGGFVGSSGAGGPHIQHIVVYNEQQLIEKLKSSTAREILVTHLLSQGVKNRVGIRT